MPTISISATRQHCPQYHAGFQCYWKNIDNVTTKIFVSITSGASKVIDDITPAYNTHLTVY
jgi:hypothetical protein